MPFNPYFNMYSMISPVCMFTAVHPPAIQIYPVIEHCHYLRKKPCALQLSPHLPSPTSRKLFHLLPVSLSLSQMVRMNGILIYHLLSLAFLHSIQIVSIWQVVCIKIPFPFVALHGYSFLTLTGTLFPPFAAIINNPDMKIHTHTHFPVDSFYMHVSLAVMLLISVVHFWISQLYQCCSSLFYLLVSNV